nr:MAG TPA: hypothetical protein [Caudoviricetes sp.]
MRGHKKTKSPVHSGLGLFCYYSHSIPLLYQMLSN